MNCSWLSLIQTLSSESVAWQFQVQWEAAHVPLCSECVVSSPFLFLLGGISLLCACLCFLSFHLRDHLLFSAHPRVPCVPRVLSVLDWGSYSGSFIVWGLVGWCDRTGSLKLHPFPLDQWDMIFCKLHRALCVQGLVFPLLHDEQYLILRLSCWICICL